MAAEWHEESLNDLVEIKHGFAFQGEFFHDEPPGDFLLTPGNFAIGGGFKGDKLKYFRGPTPEEFVLAAGDLLVSMTDLSKAADTLGYPALVPQSGGANRYLHNQRLGKVLIKPGAPLEKRFLYYVLCGREYRNEVIASATGTTVKHTSPTRIGKFRFKLPGVEEQRAIANILGAIDDKIELSRRMIETLEGMTRALFTSWFVHFDPVHAKAEARDTGLPQSISELIPGSFEATELGDVPKGWQIRSLGDICRRVSMGPFGSDIKTDNFLPVGVPVVRGGNLKDDFVDDRFVYLSEEKATELKNANAFSGDIVITHRGTLGQVGIIPRNSRFRRYVVSQSQMVLSVDPSQASPEFIFSFLCSKDGQHQLLANTSQTGVPAIARPTSSVKAIRIVLPPIEVLRFFDRIVGKLSERRNTGRVESRTLIALRDELLPKLISGELRVPDAERIVGAQA